ncbi:MAG: tRNA uridine-5-carboxymethylaminomethyl(34) synthesis GTPase MnmE [Treponema sp.]|jgi:tRNA modification GTPase|nr:tRNA uridine-5-carboxymethylaminomethyl(34) synthesis GTPase MnmE [Treponema sp.]
MIPSYGDRDPIAAIATPLAESALALIRTSGGVSGEQKTQSAIELLAGVFSNGEKLKSAPGNSLVLGWITDPFDGKKIDQVMVSVYRAPHSYTGEDSADISCHGGIAIAKTIITVLKKAGFREALPGEFTFRAFMNGKLDLTRAESVMELVVAKTHKAREQAVRRLAGALEKEITEVKDLLVEVLSGAEIYLDYSEDEFIESDEDEAAGRLPGKELAEKAEEKLKSLAENWRRERIYVEGALAVLAGRPNAGKSSLFNYLVREDRSIVTGTPGTTRDWIEVIISIEDIPLRLADTAGLRNFIAGDPDYSGTDIMEGKDAEFIGITRSLELLEKADLVLYVIDGLEGITAEDRDFLSRHKAPEKHILMLWNKSDLKQPSNEAAPEKLLAVSAKTGEGIPDLTRSIAEALAAPRKTSGENLPEVQREAPGTMRQKELINSALASVQEALALAEQEEPLDIIAPLFRSAINSLGEITGEVSNADILEVMFSRFCVGK